MSKLDPETEMKMYKHLAIVCPKCGYQFLPWHCFSICTKETEWEDAHYCPGCGNLAKDKDYERVI